MRKYNSNKKSGKEPNERRKYRMGQKRNKKRKKRWKTNKQSLIKPSLSSCYWSFTVNTYVLTSCKPRCLGENFTSVTDVLLSTNIARFVWKMSEQNETGFTHIPSTWDFISSHYFSLFCRVQECYIIYSLTASVLLLPQVKMQYLQI